MSSWNHVLAGIVVFGLAAALNPCLSPAAAFPVRWGVEPMPGTRAVPAFFHGHTPSGISYYCYWRNYWWFYRPYTTAAADYARCMPYFHYPPQAYRSGGGGQMK